MKSVGQRSGGASLPFSAYPAAADEDGHILRSAFMQSPTRTARPEYMKELNLLIVLEAFRVRGGMSRADVARATGISAPTVSKITGRLVESGLLIDGGPGASSGGKRPSILRFNIETGYVLGVDLGGTNLRVALARLDGSIVQQSAARIDPNAGPAAIIAQIAARGHDLLARCGRSLLLAVAVATPGLVDVEAGVVVSARNLAGWQQVPVRAELERAFSVPVSIENDVNAAAVGERWHGAGAGHESLAFVSIGTGVGAGIIIGGQIRRGRHFGAGEIGSLPGGIHSGSGREPSVEDVAGGPGITARANGKGWHYENAAEVFAAARRGDPSAEHAVCEAVIAIARGVTAIVAVADPSVIVFGGGLSREGDGFIRRVRESVESLVPVRAEFVRSRLGVDAQLHGAVFAALRMADEALVSRVRAAGA